MSISALHSGSNATFYPGNNSVGQTPPPFQKRSVGQPTQVAPSKPQTPVHTDAYVNTHASCIKRLVKCIKNLVNSIILRIRKLAHSIKDFFTHAYLIFRWKRWAKEPARYDNERTYRNEFILKMRACNDCLRFKSSESNRLHFRPDGITKLPPGMNSLSNLKHLDLDDNRLTTLPREIGSLSKLETLSLQFNSFVTFPAPICALSNLKDLYFGFNRLTNFPAEIDALSKLEDLSLNDNDLVTFPAPICSLSNLKRLMIHYNRISTLPPEIGALKNLIELQICNNQITHLPDEIGDLENLSRLYLQDNQLNALPNTIGRLANLQSFYVHRNRLEDLPDEIFNLPSTCEVDIPDHSIYMERSGVLIRRVNTPGYHGPRFRLSANWVIGAKNEAPPPLYQVVASFFPALLQLDIQKKWAKVQSNPNAEQLSKFLTRVAKIPSLREEAKIWLEKVYASETLLKKTLLLAHDGTETCHDRVLLTFSNMQKEYILDEVEQGKYNEQLEDLDIRLRQLFRIEKLFEISTKKIQDMEAAGLKDIDDIEVHLAYQIKLREPLRLDWVPKEMAYLSFSKLQDSDWNSALESIRQQEITEYPAWFSQSPAWLKQIAYLEPALHKTATDRLYEAVTADNLKAQIDRKLQALKLEHDQEAYRVAERKVLERPEVIQQVEAALRTADSADSTNSADSANDEAALRAAEKSILQQPPIKQLIQDELAAAKLQDKKEAYRAAEKKVLNQDDIQLQVEVEQQKAEMQNDAAGLRIAQKKVLANPEVKARVEATRAATKLALQEDTRRNIAKQYTDEKTAAIHMKLTHDVLAKRGLAHLPYRNVLDET